MNDLIKQAEEYLKNAYLLGQTEIIITALVQRVKELEQQRAESDSKLMILRQKLSCYQGGVEVEGYVSPTSGLIAVHAGKKLAQFKRQRVRVLVMPEDRIVDINKTMKGVE